MLSRLSACLGGLAVPPFVPQCVSVTPAGPYPSQLPSPITDAFLDMLQLPHIWTVPVADRAQTIPTAGFIVPPTPPVAKVAGRSVRDPNEVSLSSDEEEGDGEGAVTYVIDTVGVADKNALDIDDI